MLGRMKTTLHRKRAATRLLTFTVLCINLFSATGWAGVAIPPNALIPLNQIPVPQPPNLFQYVKNKPAAVRLGKALFWDMQAGSDGMTACGTCHFSAGADNRRRNTLNPGTNAGDTKFEVRGPDETLKAADFPFHQRQAPVDFKSSSLLRDANDVVGSQGVTLKQFVGIVAGSAQDNGFPLADPVFHDNGINLRQVTGRNAPSVVNSVFNFTNFWDGRASAFFNGSSSLGPLDQGAGVWYSENGTLVRKPVSIVFASLASQATEPPLNETEMSYRGRSFPELGRKMLSLTPLGKQTVHPDDSELGNLSNAALQSDGTLSGRKGLRIGYAQMIRDAFVDELWNSNLQTPDGFGQMEANFSLFWGLAIQLYEATLVADDTPFDRFLGGATQALSSEQQDGFNLFFGAARCDACHGGTELTNASVRAARYIFNADNQEHGLMELMPVASGQQIIYDFGFNNTAVRPTAEDFSRSALSPFNNPLTGAKFPFSFSALAELQAQGKLPFATPVLIPGVPATFPVANGGAFKVPGLRNVELTAPYMHNGSMLTLEEVVDFYARGGNFPTANKEDLDINILELPALQNNSTAKAALVSFMKSMTDERVRNEEAPFDRPEIFIPNGNDSGGFVRLPAKDINGESAQPLPIVTLAPVTTPTVTASQLLSGTKESGAIIQIKVNGGLTLPADNGTDTTWSSTVGLIAGDNSITVSATDITGDVTTLTTSIAFTPPQLTGSVVINGGDTVTKSQAAVLTLRAVGPAPVAQMQFSKDGVNFYEYEQYASSRNVTLLPGEGVRSIYVRFKDSAGNVSTIYSDSILVDSTPPTGMVSINGGTTLTNSGTATLSLTATDVSGITQMQFSKDGVNYYPLEPFAVSRTVTLPAGDGIKNIFVRFKDGAGNLSAPVSTAITLDQTGPTGTVALTSQNPTALQTGIMALEAYDANGVTQMQFAKNGSAYYPWEPFATIRSVTLLPGLNTLTVRFKDGAGNISAPVTTNITLDSNKPTGAIQVTTPNPTTSSTATLYLAASDTTSGVTQMQFAKNGSAYYPWEPFAAIRSVTLLPGLNTLTVRFKDEAGNVSDPTSVTITKI